MLFVAKYGSTPKKEGAGYTPALACRNADGVRGR
jgi:hypothetical protein